MLLLTVVHASGQFEGPVPKKPVDPEYPPDFKAYFLQPVKVELVIDDLGVPFSLKASAGLPDNVVQALEKSRYKPARKDGSAVPAAMDLWVPVRRPIEGSGRLARFWLRSKEESEALAVGKELTSADAARLEEDLKANAGDRIARLKLLAYSTTLKKDEAERSRLNQILWFARTDPTTGILGSPLATLPAIAPANDETFRQIRQIWLEQLAANPKDPVILDHASNALRLSDPAVVEKALLQQVGRNEKAAQFLGEVYGLAGLGVTAAGSSFAARVRSLLEGTDDLAVLFSALTAVTEADPRPEGYAEFCGQLLSRAKSYYPATALACDGNPPHEGPLGMIRVGGNVQMAMITKQVKPQYPPEARARRLQGTVKFSAVIGQDGRMRKVELLSGPFLLYKPSRGAVVRWEYKPTLLNGKPVEVMTSIDVNYAM
jgi:hypothetical protein